MSHQVAIEKYASNKFKNKPLGDLPHVLEHKHATQISLHCKQTDRMIHRQKHTLTESIRVCKPKNNAKHNGWANTLYRGRQLKEFTILHSLHLFMWKWSSSNCSNCPMISIILNYSTKQKKTKVPDFSFHNVIKQALYKLCFVCSSWQESWSSFLHHDHMYTGWEWRKHVCCTIQLQTAKHNFKFSKKN